jgi:hypothetical protein
MFGDGVAELAEFDGEEGRGLLFVMGELGIMVEVLVGLGERGELAVYGGGQVGRGLRGE